MFVCVCVCVCVCAHVREFLFENDSGDNMLILRSNNKVHLKFDCFLIWLQVCGNDKIFK